MLVIQVQVKIESHDTTVLGLSLRRDESSLTLFPLSSTPSSGEFATGGGCDGAEYQRFQLGNSDDDEKAEKLPKAEGKLFREVLVKILYVATHSLLELRYAVSALCVGSSNCRRWERCGTWFKWGKYIKAYLLQMLLFASMLLEDELRAITPVLWNDQKSPGPGQDFPNLKSKQDEVVRRAKIVGFTLRYTFIFEAFSNRTSKIVNGVELLSQNTDGLNLLKHAFAMKSESHLLEAILYSKAKPGEPWLLVVCLFCQRACVANQRRR